MSGRLPGTPVPQLGQNLASGGFEEPQFWHFAGDAIAAAPHSLQNLASPGLSWPHEGQIKMSGIPFAKVSLSCGIVYVTLTLESANG